MQQRSKTIFLLILCVSLISCTGGRGGMVDQDFQTGTQALQYRFIAPQGNLFQGQNSEIVIGIDNRGASPIRQGYINLIVESPYIQIIGNHRQRFSLQGRSTMFPQGEQSQIRYPIIVGDMDRQSVERKTTVLANVCYDYMTQLNEVVCIDPDPYDFSRSIERQVCRVTDIRSSGQGAPLVIDAVGVTMVRDGTVVYPTFSISVQNRGNGIAVSSDRVNQLCSNSPLTTEQLNTFSVMAMLGETQLECDQHVVQLRNKQARIQCRDTRGIDPSLGVYQTPLYIRLTYGYSDTISKEITIVR